MNKYKVLVPFESVIKETLSSTITIKLAESFILAGISITEEKEVYNAELVIEASKHSEAKTLAVYRIEEILSLFAIWNDGFRIIISGVKSEKIEAEEQKASVEKFGDKTIHIHAKETIEIGEHVSVVKRKSNFKFEENALKWCDKWADWLKLALNLNYLAVVSDDFVPSLILRYSALETVTENILGSPESLLKSKFKERTEEKKELLKTIEKLFRDYGLGNESNHLINRIRETHVEGKNRRIQKAMEICNVDAQIQDINFVSEIRGKVVHPIKSSDIDDLRRAVSFIEEWIRKSLQFLLGNPNT